MRKKIQSTSFIAHLTNYIGNLKQYRNKAKNEKNEAKDAYKNCKREISKDEINALKTAYLQAKINFKATNAAYKAASKVIADYIVEGEIKNDKNKHLGGPSNSSDDYNLTIDDSKMKTIQPKKGIKKPKQLKVFQSTEDTNESLPTKAKESRHKSKTHKIITDTEG